MFQIVTGNPSAFQLRFYPRCVTKLPNWFETLICIIMNENYLSKVSFLTWDEQLKYFKNCIHDSVYKSPYCSFSILTETSNHLHEISRRMISLNDAHSVVKLVLSLVQMCKATVLKSFCLDNLMLVHTKKGELLSCKATYVNLYLGIFQKNAVGKTVFNSQPTINRNIKIRSEFILHNKRAPSSWVMYKQFPLFPLQFSKLKIWKLDY